MEALTAVSAAALTIYDMLKAADREMVIGEICVVEKKGGRSGHYRRRGTVSAAGKRCGCRAGADVRDVPARPASSWIQNPPPAAQKIRAWGTGHQRTCTLPMTYFFGTMPQCRLSELLFRWSPMTK